MKTYHFIGSYAVNQLADELVRAGVPMGGEARIDRNAFPLATDVTIVANNSAVDATVNAVVAAHAPIGIVDAATVAATAQTVAAAAAAQAQATAIAACAPAVHAHGMSEVNGLVAGMAGKETSGAAAAAQSAAGIDATNKANAAQANAIAAIPNASYRTILDASGSHTAAKVAGTYAMGVGDPLAVSGTGTLYPLAIIDLAAADYPTVNGIAPKLRIRAVLETNDVAPFVGTFTVGLFPITRPATSGGAGLCIYTLGTVVLGSNGAVFTNPPADGNLAAVGADFAFPANGRYVVGVVTSGVMLALAHVHINASLQMRNA